MPTKTTYGKGKRISAGKTKEIYEAFLPGNDFVDKTLVIVRNKKDVTAFNDPNYTQIMEEKDVFATNTTCRVFELLRDCGIPVAYEEQLSATEFLAQKCDMINLEIIGRRYVMKGSSYLKRNPGLPLDIAGRAWRFRNLEVELFLKTTKGKLVIDGKTLFGGLAKEDDDPIIADFNKKEWELLRPYKPFWDPDADLKITANERDILPPDVTVEKITDLLTRVFLILEAAWNGLNVRLLDIKIELGITADRKLVVADVIDNDSWRTVTSDWIDLSKEAFRQGESLEIVKQKYQAISNMVGQFRVPKQVLVLWMGSLKDHFSLETENLISRIKETGINTERVVLSGHKQTLQALDKLEELQALFPEGGVIVDFIGRSNGGGPILSTHTLWPVINVPMTMNNFPNDVFSNVRMPSYVPCLTAWPEENAIKAALNILAMKNPRVYMERKMAIEEMDG